MKPSAQARGHACHSQFPMPVCSSPPNTHTCPSASVAIDSFEFSLYRNEVTGWPLYLLVWVWFLMLRIILRCVHGGSLFLNCIPLCGSTFFPFIWFTLGLLPVWGYFGPLCGHVLLCLLDKDLEVWFSYSNHCVVASSVSLLCFCLMTSDVEHLFTCLFTSMCLWWSVHALTHFYIVAESTWKVNIYMFKHHLQQPQKHQAPRNTLDKICTATFH